MKRKYLKVMINLLVTFALILNIGGIGLFPHSAYGANSSFPLTGWTKADGITPGYDNLSNNSGRSEFPQIVLDTSGRPNIVWNDWTTGNCDIFFSKWNGATWTKADGLTPGYDNVSNNSSTSNSYQMVLDSNSRPNIVWQDYTPGNCDIFFSRWNGTTWTKADGKTSGYDNISHNSGDSEYPQIALDSSSKANIVWHDATTGYADIYFSRWNGTTWTKADGATSGYDNLSHNSGDSASLKIVLDSNGRPNIVWDDHTPGNFDTFFSRWNGSCWTGADGKTSRYDNISHNSGDSASLKIVLDSNGRPNIAWEDNTPTLFDIFFSRWNGTAWTKADGTTPGYDNISHNSDYSEAPQIALDSSGRPNIVWVDSTPGNFDTFFSRWNGSCWTGADGTTPGYDNISHNSGNSWDPQIVLDSSGRPNIVWCGDTAGNGDIFFSRWNGSCWTGADGVTSGYDNLSSNSGNSYSPQIALDTSGRPNIVWSDYTTGGGDIYFSKWSGITFFRLAGASRYETAVEVSKQGWHSSDKVVLSRGDDFPDALSGAALAGKYNCPILLTYPMSLNQATKDEINRLGASEVIILGSEDAISPQVVEDLKNQCGITEDKVKRIGGEDRYDTSGLIAQSLGSIGEKAAFIATGENFPDALASASLAYWKKIPIFLVGSDKISPEIQKAFTSLGIKKVIPVGGTDVVPDSYVDWFVQKGASVETRLAGDDRYGTAKAIADYEISKGMDASKVCIATGENFPDALACGPFAGKNNSVILLTSNNLLRSQTKDWITSNKANIYSVYIAGGPDVVSDGVKDEIWGMINIEYAQKCVDFKILVPNETLGRRLQEVIVTTKPNPNEKRGVTLSYSVGQSDLLHGVVDIIISEEPISPPFQYQEYVKEQNSIISQVKVNLKPPATFEPPWYLVKINGKEGCCQECGPLILNTGEIDSWFSSNLMWDDNGVHFSIAGGKTSGADLIKLAESMYE